MDSEHNKENLIRDLEVILDDALGLVDSNPDRSRKLANQAKEFAVKHRLKDIQAKALMLLCRLTVTHEGTLDALELGRQAVELIKDSDNGYLKSKIYNGYGNCLHYYKRSLEALIYFEKALEIARSIGDAACVIPLLNNLGNCYRALGLQGQSFESYTKCIEAAEKAGNKELKATAFTNLGYLLTQEKKPEEARVYLEQALDMQMDIGERVGVGYTLNNLGNLNVTIHRYDEAEEYFKRAIDLWTQLKMDVNLDLALKNLSDLKRKERKLEEAEEILLRRIELVSRSDNPAFIIHAEADLAFLRIEMSKLDGVEEPILKFLDSLRNSISDTIDDIKNKSQIFKSLSQLYRHRSEFEKALDLFELKAEMDIVIERAAIEEGIEKTRLRLEYEKIVSDRKLLEKQKEELEVANRQLSDALEQIKTLGGLLPICSHCNKIRDDSGYWKQLEVYIGEHSDAVFSHSLCPSCQKTLYPDHIVTDESPGKLSASGR